jgi:hypothetical protein
LSLSRDEIPLRDEISLRDEIPLRDEIMIELCYVQLHITETELSNIKRAMAERGKTGLIDLI